MAPEVIRLEEGFGTEGLGQTEGIGQMEGVGQMEGTKKIAPSRAPAPSAAPKRQIRSGLPSMRSAVVWAEILGKPKALKGRR